MGVMASQITSLTSVYSNVYSGVDQRKHQSSASLAFVWGIHRGPVNSPDKWPVTRKMFSFEDAIMNDVEATCNQRLVREISNQTCLIRDSAYLEPTETSFNKLMMTPSNENLFRVTVTGEFSSQRPVTRSFDVFFDLCLNKRLSKPSRRHWFETPSRSLWRHCNIVSSLTWNMFC